MSFGDRKKLEELSQVIKTVIESWIGCQVGLAAEYIDFVHLFAVSLLY